MTARPDLSVAHSGGRARVQRRASRSSTRVDFFRSHDLVNDVEQWYLAVHLAIHNNPHAVRLGISDRFGGHSRRLGSRHIPLAPLRGHQRWRPWRRRVSGRTRWMVVWADAAIAPLANWILVSMGICRFEGVDLLPRQRSSSGVTASGHLGGVSQLGSGVELGMATVQAWARSLERAVDQNLRR